MTSSAEPSQPWWNISANNQEGLAIVGKKAGLRAVHLGSLVWSWQVLGSLNLQYFWRTPPTRPLTCT